MAHKDIKVKTKSNSTIKQWLFIIFVMLAIPICSVYTKAILSESNIKLEALKSDIKEQQGINEGLKMEISELASLDKIESVAKENGLSYQNNNIKVVTSDDKDD